METIETLILKALNGVLFITDKTEQIKFCQGMIKESLGYTEEEVINQPVSSFFYPEDRKILLANIKYIAIQKGHFEGRVALINKSGEKRFFILYLTKLDHPIYYWPYVLKDITHYVEKEKEKQEQLKLTCLGEIVTVLAHHIRNPVTGIGGFSKRALKICAQNEKCQRYLTIIRQQAARLEKLTKILETFVYLPSPRFEPVNFLQMIKTQLRKWSKQFPDRRWRFRVEKNYRPLSLKIMADYALIKLAIEEVIKNACDFTTSGDKISFFIGKRQSDTKEYVQFVVEDSGQGISEKDLASVCELFYTTKPQEIGLGLAMAQKVIKMHEGEIILESQKGQGTRVTIFLPIDRRRMIRYKLVKDVQTEPFGLNP